MRRILVLVSLAAAGLTGLVFADGAATNQNGTPAAPGDLPEGIAIEHLAGTSSLPFGPAATSAGLARYTYALAARLELPYAGPVLAYVEVGTLSLEAVGSAVSIRQPQEATVLATPGGGRFVSIRQEGAAPAEGERADVRAGGSVYAPDGNLGPTRNGADKPLVLLVVSFVTQPEDGGMSATVRAAPAGPLLEATPPP